MIDIIITLLMSLPLMFSEALLDQILQLIWFFR